MRGTSEECGRGHAANVAANVASVAASEPACGAVDGPASRPAELPGGRASTAVGPSRGPTRGAAAVLGCLALTLALAAPANAQLGRISAAARGDSNDRDSDDRGSSSSSRESSSDSSGSSGSSGSGSSSSRARASTSRGGGTSVRVARAPVDRRLLSRATTNTSPNVRVEAPRATVRPATVRTVAPTVRVEAPRATVRPVTVRPVPPTNDPRRTPPAVTVRPSAPPPVHVRATPVQGEPVPSSPARPLDPTVQVYLDVPTDGSSGPSEGATCPSGGSGLVAGDEPVGGVGFVAPPSTVVDAPIASAPKPDEAPVLAPRRTRAHLGLDLGPTRIHGVDGRIVRTSFDGRVQFRRSFDLDLAYALLVDGETALGLGRLGGAVRVIDGTNGFVRLGASYTRLRDVEGVVHGAELAAGFGFEGRRLSTIFDAGMGRLGASWTLTVRWTVGVLLTRGLELVFGVDHMTMLPEAPATTVRFTTPTLGLRVLL